VPLPTWCALYWDNPHCHSPAGQGGEKRGRFSLAASAQGSPATRSRVWDWFRRNCCWVTSSTSNVEVVAQPTPALCIKVLPLVQKQAIIAPLENEGVGMPRKEELVTLPLAKLMSLCRHVAGDPAHYTQSASDEALRLMGEWLSLQRVPSRETDMQLWALEERAAEFLARTL